MSRCGTLKPNLIFSFKGFLLSVIKRIFPPLAITCMLDIVFLKYLSLGAIIITEAPLRLRPKVRASFHQLDNLPHVSKTILLILMHLLRRLEKINPFLKTLIRLRNKFFAISCTSFSLFKHFLIASEVF